MTQSDLHRALARATGESVRHLRKMGFSLVTPPSRRARKLMRQEYARKPSNSPMN